MNGVLSTAIEDCKFDTEDSLVQFIEVLVTKSTAPSRNLEVDSVCMTCVELSDTKVERYAVLLNSYS